MNYKINTVMDNKKLGQVKNLIMLALADGKASESELAIIASVASREKLSESEVTHLIDNPDSVKIELPDDESLHRGHGVADDDRW